MKVEELRDYGKSNSEIVDKTPMPVMIKLGCDHDVAGYP